MPTVESILLTIRTVCETLIAILAFLQTEQGKKLIEQGLADRSNWDKFWNDTWSGVVKLFNNEMWKAQA